MNSSVKGLQIDRIIGIGILFICGYVLVWIPFYFRESQLILGTGQGTPWSDHQSFNTETNNYPHNHSHLWAI